MVKLKYQVVIVYDFTDIYRIHEHYLGNGKIIKPVLLFFDAQNIS